MLGADDLRFLLLGLFIRIIAIIIFLVSLSRDCAGVRTRLSWGLLLLTTALPDKPESRLLRCCRTLDARATRRPAAPGFLPAGLVASGLLGLASMSVVANSLAPGFPFLGGFSAISLLLPSCHFAAIFISFTMGPIIWFIVTSSAATLQRSSGWLGIT